MRRPRWTIRAAPFVAAFAACGLLSGPPVIAGAPDASAIGSGAEWHNVNGDSNETGYSRLDQITAANAGRLGLAWYLDLPGEASLEASPIEVKGLLYFTGSYATVYAVDAASGRLVWKYEPKTWEHNPTKMNYGFGANRGAAYRRRQNIFRRARRPAIRARCEDGPHDLEHRDHRSQAAARP